MRKLLGRLSVESGVDNLKRPALSSNVVPSAYKTFARALEWSGFMLYFGTNVSTHYARSLYSSPLLPGCCTSHANTRQVDTLVQPFAQPLSLSLYRLSGKLCGCLGISTTGSGEQYGSRHGFQLGTLVARHTVEIKMLPISQTKNPAI